MSLQEIFSKPNSAWQLAIATALGAYGGFPDPPSWWKNLSKRKEFQFLTLWILVFQGGGNAEADASASAKRNNTYDALLYQK